MTVHHLKTLTQLYNDTGTLKTFEVRRADRDFKVGDILWLAEWNAETGYTGASKKYEVSYILRGGEWGIMKGFCIMGLKLGVLIR